MNKPMRVDRPEMAELLTVREAAVVAERSPTYAWFHGETRIIAANRRYVNLAYETALAICKDPKAPAQARAIASRTIFQLAGMLNKPEPETPKEPSEMTAEELEQSRQAFLRKRDLMRRDSSQSSGIFG
jgi:hypothetical protein